MIPVNETTMVGAFLIFCRIGLCFALAPGLSSPRVPMRARLLLSVGLTLALSPSLLDKAMEVARSANQATLALSIFSECLIGVTLGLMARFMSSALETLSAAIAMSIGMGSLFGPRMDEGDALPELATFISLAATNMLFLTNQHWELVRALHDSYRTFDMAVGFDPRIGLGRIAETLSYAFPLALRIASPFLLFGILANFAFGLVNKIVPQIAVYFVSVPFVIAGGLALLYILSNTIFSIYVDGFSAMLARG